MKYEENKPMWENREEDAYCKNCVWFMSKMNGLGRCRRHAPTIIGFPQVFENDICGDIRLDDRKIESEKV